MQFQAFDETINESFHETASNVLIQSSPVSYILAQLANLSAQKKSHCYDHLLLDGPLDTINPAKDSTYLLIHEFVQNLDTRLYSIDTCNDPAITTHGSTIKAFTIGDPLSVETSTIPADGKDIDFTWLRKDPPVNESYMQELLILNRFSQQIRPINHIPAILLNNEKLAATQFPDLSPPTGKY